MATAGDHNEPPSPSGSFFFGNALAFQSDPLGALTRWHDELGDLFQLQMPFRVVTVVTDPDLIQQIVERDYDRFRVGPLTRQAFEGFEEDALIHTEGEQWQRLRGLMQPHFTSAAVTNYQNRISRIVDEQIDNWQEGQTLNLLDEMSTVTIRTVSECLFEEKLTKDDISTVKEAADELVRRADARNSRGVLPRWVPVPSNLSFNRAKSNLYDLIDRMIHQKREQEGEPSDLLGQMVRAEKSGDLTNSELRENLLEFFLAGADTTAAGLTYTFYCLGNHPGAKQELVERLEMMFEADSFHPEGVLETDEFSAAINEALRLYPPAFTIARTTAGEYELDGYRFPEGSGFLLPQWVVHRDDRFFEDPLTYRPTRWTESRDRPKFSYFPFGGGDRYCIGKHFAMMEMPIILARVLQRVDFSVVTEEIAEFVPSITLRPGHSVEMVVEQVRNGEENDEAR